MVVYHKNVPSYMRWEDRNTGLHPEQLYRLLPHAWDEVSAFLVGGDCEPCLYGDKRIEVTAFWVNGQLVIVSLAACRL